MHWAWATSLDELWHSPTFPMWVTLIAAGFSALVVLIVLLRADKTMANGALAVIALLSIGIASTSTVRGFSPSARPAEFVSEQRVPVQQAAPLPALACLDGLAGESVETACERAVFGSADTAAAAVSYAAGQVSRIVATGSARSLTPEQQVLKRAVERDRYGLIAQVVTARERCVVTDCPLFRVLSDASQIKANMNENLYDTLVARYASSWNSAAAAPSSAAGLLPGVPTGKPTTVDFATSTSIPPVSIMTAEPPPQPARQAAPAPHAAPATSSAKSSNAQAQAKRAPAAAQQQPATAGGASHQPAASIGKPRVVAPVPYMPPSSAEDSSAAIR